MPAAPCHRPPHEEGLLAVPPSPSDHGLGPACGPRAASPRCSSTYSSSDGRISGSECTSSPVGESAAACRVACVPHIRQRYSWDCGLACVLMILKALGIPCSFDDLRRLCNTTSIWTVDLAHLLAGFGVTVTFNTVTIGVNHSYANEHFYMEHLTGDQARVQALFEAARHPVCGVTMVQRSTGLLPLVQHLTKEGGVAVVLVDKRKLDRWQAAADACWNSVTGYTSQTSYMGHYVLLVGYDPSTSEFIVHDPDCKRGFLRICASVLDAAWCCFGTDEDVLLVDLEVPQQQLAAQRQQVAAFWQQWHTHYQQQVHQQQMYQQQVYQHLARGGYHGVGSSPFQLAASGGFHPFCIQLQQQPPSHSGPWQPQEQHLQHQHHHHQQQQQVPFVRPCCDTDMEDVDVPESTAAQQPPATAEEAPVQHQLYQQSSSHAPYWLWHWPSSSKASNPAPSGQAAQGSSARQQPADTAAAEAPAEASGGAPVVGQGGQVALCAEACSSRADPCQQWQLGPPPCALHTAASGPSSHQDGAAPQPPPPAVLASLWQYLYRLNPGGSSGGSGSGSGSGDGGVERPSSSMAAAPAAAAAGYDGSAVGYQELPGPDVGVVGGSPFLTPAASLELLPADLSQFMQDHHHQHHQQQGGQPGVPTQWEAAGLLIPVPDGGSVEGGSPPCVSPRSCFSPGPLAGSDPSAPEAPAGAGVTAQGYWYWPYVHWLSYRPAAPPAGASGAAGGATHLQQEPLDQAEQQQQQQPETAQQQQQQQRQPGTAQQQQHQEEEVQLTATPEVPAALGDSDEDMECTSSSAAASAATAAPATAAAPAPAAPATAAAPAPAVAAAAAAPMQSPCPQPSPQQLQLPPQAAPGGWYWLWSGGLKPHPPDTAPVTACSDVHPSAADAAVVQATQDDPMPDSTAVASHSTGPPSSAQQPAEAAGGDPAVVADINAAAAAAAAAAEGPAAAASTGPTAGPAVESGSGQGHWYLYLFRMVAPMAAAPAAAAAWTGPPPPPQQQGTLHEQQQQPQQQEEEGGQQGGQHHQQQQQEQQHGREGQPDTVEAIGGAPGHGGGQLPSEDCSEGTPACAAGDPAPHQQQQQQPGTATAPLEVRMPTEKDAEAGAPPQQQQQQTHYWAWYWYWGRSAQQPQQQQQQQRDGKGAGVPEQQRPQQAPTPTAAPQQSPCDGGSSLRPVEEDQAMADPDADLDADKPTPSLDQPMADVDPTALSTSCTGDAAAAAAGLNGQVPAAAADGNHTQQQPAGYTWYWYRSSKPPGGGSRRVEAPPSAPQPPAVAAC